MLVARFQRYLLSKQIIQSDFITWFLHSGLGTNIRELQPSMIEKLTQLLQNQLSADGTIESVPFVVGGEVNPIFLAGGEGLGDRTR